MKHKLLPPHCLSMYFAMAFVLLFSSSVVWAVDTDTSRDSAMVEAAKQELLDLQTKESASVLEPVEPEPVFQETEERP